MSVTPTQGQDLDIALLMGRAEAQLDTYPSLSRNAKIKRSLRALVDLLRGNHGAADKVRYSWPQSLLALSLERGSAKTGDHQVMAALMRYVNRWKGRGAPLYHLDMAMIGHPVIYLGEKGAIEDSLPVAERIADYLLHQPRDREGSLFYRASASPMVLADTLGITCPLLVRLGRYTARPELISLAAKQFDNFWNFGFQDSTGLPYHGYSLSKQEQLGIVGWGRAVGWAALGLAMTLEYSGGCDEWLPKERNVHRLGELLDVSAGYQKPSGALSWQLQAEGGPDDTSATGMVGFAAKTALVNSWTESKAVVDLWRGAENAIQARTTQGLVAESSAECNGVGEYPQVYGEYPWGTAPALLLAAARAPLETA